MPVGWLLGVSVGFEEGGDVGEVVGKADGS